MACSATSDLPRLLALQVLAEFADMAGVLAATATTSSVEATATDAFAAAFLQGIALIGEGLAQESTAAIPAASVALFVKTVGAFVQIPGMCDSAAPGGGGAAAANPLSTVSVLDEALRDACAASVGSAGAFPTDEPNAAFETDSFDLQCRTNDVAGGPVVADSASATLA
jgi:hypothetical protein